MTQLLTVHQPCRIELECPDGVPAPGPASAALLKCMFSVRGKSVLDLGCGCGLFAIAAAKLGASESWAVDSSTRAVDCTRRNAERNGVDVVAKVGDLFEAVADRAFDLLITLPQGSFDEIALDRLEPILREAPDHLERGGELLTGVPATDATPRFESMLDERFRFRRLPATPMDGAAGFLLNLYLAMKR